MKKTAALSFVILLFACAASFAQDKTPDYSGDWKLDTGKSELGQRSNIESMTMKVTQTESQITFTRNATRGESEAPRRGRGRGFGGGGSQVYDLSGKETKSEAGGRFGGEVVRKAEAGDEDLKLTSTMNIDTPRGAISIKSTETWSLSDDGKTLTVNVSRETPRGSRTSKMVFTKIQT